MTRYDLVAGGDAFISDTAVLGFLFAADGYTTVVTLGGQFQVRGQARELHEAWCKRRMDAAENDALMSAMRR